MTPEQEKIIDRCYNMLKNSFREFKRVVFHLNPDKGPGTVEYEIHGKVKTKGIK